jgi:peptidoglycan L-alanyl-D-glutamate endopeptidase CwlK
MSFRFGKRSEGNLKGVHPDLVRVMRRAIRTTKIDFVVIEGLRTVERQRQLVASGASRTMKSRHIHGFAVDIAPIGPDGKVSFKWDLYYALIPAVKKAAADEGVMVEFGADWKRFPDAPHIQLPHAAYPDPKEK